MGFFDLLKNKKQASAPANTASATASPATPGGTVIPRLVKARGLLEAKDLPAAVALYQEVLEEAGERADVLVTISGDLGVLGHVKEIVELIAPLYDAQRHGHGTGLNVLQAYLALGNAEAAQHVLDILFELDRPELEERLHGFSNAIADLMEARRRGLLPVQGAGHEGHEEGQAAPVEIPRINLITLSKPIWFYGLEPLAGEILPPKSGRPRRVAFAQLALPGAYEDFEAALLQPEDDLSRLSRAIPLWLAETLFFSPNYLPLAVVGVLQGQQQGNPYALFGAEWTVENLRQLIDSNSEPLDYIFTGALTRKGDTHELTLRLWEVNKLRERKQLTARWTPATLNEELAAFRTALHAFMELKNYPAGQGIPYSSPAELGSWLGTLGASLGLFLVEKKLLSVSRLAPLGPDLERSRQDAALSLIGSLACLTLGSRAARLGLAAAQGEPLLAQDPLVAKACAVVQG
jgi:hypothetical protein